MHPVTDRLGIAWAGGARLTSPARRLLPSPLGLALLGGILLVAFFKLMDWTAELLWFRALGYEEVFWRLLFAKVAMFAIGFIPVFVYVLLNLLVLTRLAGWRNPTRTCSPHFLFLYQPQRPQFSASCSLASGIDSYAWFGPRTSGGRPYRRRGTSLGRSRECIGDAG